jgi:hypothetical protein
VGSVLLLGAVGDLPVLVLALAAAGGVIALGYAVLLLTGRVVRLAFALNVLAVGLLVAAVVASGSRIVA